VIFDDEARLAIDDPGLAAPFGPGRRRPSPGRLRAFDGMTAGGEWRLLILDNLVGDTGTLLTFEVHATAAPLLVPHHANPVAQAAATSMNSIIPAEFLGPDPDLFDAVSALVLGPEDSTGELRALAPDEVFARTALALRSLDAHHRSLRDRLRSARPGPEPPTAGSAAASRGWLQTASLDGAPVAAAPDRDPARARGSAWVAGRGFTGSRDTTDREMGYDVDGGGGAAGLDVELGERVLLGLAGGGSGANADFDQASGRLDADAFFASLYAQVRPLERLSLDATGSWAWNHYDSRRNVVLGDFRASPSDDSDGRTFGFDGYAFYELRAGRAVFGPAFGFSYLDARADGFAESGGSIANLELGAHSARSTRTRLGGELRLDLGLAERVRIAPELFAYWVHEYQDDPPSLSAGFRRYPSALPILLDGDRPDRDFMELAAGVGASLGDRLHAWLRYETAVSVRDWDVHHFTGGVDYRF
jgi:outer membrane autotransporter protein